MCLLCDLMLWKIKVLLSSKKLRLAAYIDVNLTQPEPSFLHHLSIDWMCLSRFIPFSFTE